MQSIVLLGTKDAPFPLHNLFSNEERSTVDMARSIIRCCCPIIRSIVCDELKKGHALRIRVSCF